MNDHDRYRELVAAHVLGALEPPERTELDAHLRGCEDCRREVLDLAPIPALLSRLDIDEVEAIDGPADTTPDRLIDAVRADVAGVARSRRRWRWLAGAAAAATVAVLALVAFDDDGPGERRFDGVALDIELADAAAAEVLADERDWGTYVWVTADGLPRRDGYALWVVGTDGDWERAGTFAPTPDGSVALGGSTRRPMAEIDRIVVTSDDRTDELVSAR